MEEKQVKTNKCECPSCGATMIYSPVKQKLYCENCQSCKDIDKKPRAEKNKWEDRNKKTTDSKEWASETNNLKCPNCGANVILNKLEYSRLCPYCESSLVANEEVLQTMAPDGIIPFTFSDQEASAKYVAGMKKKWFLPNAFKKAPPTKNIHGVYIPSFAYDAETHNIYKGRLAEDHTYTDSKGHSHTTTTYQNISGEKDVNHVDVMVETSTHLNQLQFGQILPFNTDAIVKFDQSFIMGYSVEHFENSLDACREIGNKIMYEITKKLILSKYSYDRVVSFNMTTTYDNEKYTYNLMPVYQCDYTYKNKKYTTFMNGQTGKVGGGVPRSALKITLLVLFILAIVGGAIALFLLFGGNS